MESRTFQTKIQPTIDEYRQKACLHPDRQPSSPFTLPSFNNHVHPPPTADNIPQETEPIGFSHSGCSSLTSHQTGIDEEIKILGRMTNILFDNEEIEGSKLNPIMVYDSNDEPREYHG